MADAKVRDPRVPAVGTVLTRTFKGTTFNVTVTDAGFEYEGTVYKSLSRLAGEVTRQKAVNGFSFFKLGESAQKRPRTAKADATPAPTPAPVANQAAPVGPGTPQPVAAPQPVAPEPPVAVAAPPTATTSLLSENDI
jgi:hypothetical protein